MGLLDGILGNVLGGMAAGRNTGEVVRQNDNGPLGSILARLGGGSGIAKGVLLALAFQLLQRSGGISGLIEKLRNSGLGRHGDSWVGTGSNMAVSPDQLRDVFGPDAIEQIANHFGVSPDQATNSLSEVLPELVNQMTPDGQVPDNDYGMISDALKQLAPRINA
jgi:uncharacterized protein YidB (DUF937 family)